MRTLVALVAAVLLGTPHSALAQGGSNGNAALHQFHRVPDGHSPVPMAGNSPTAAAEGVPLAPPFMFEVDGQDDRGTATNSDRRGEPGSANAEAARFVQQAVAPPPTTDRENWIFRHLVLFGTVIGAGTGVVIAANVQRGEPAIILGGALGGAYGGLVASAVHKARRKEPVGPKTKLGLAAGGIGIGIASLLLVKGLGGV